jgi:hypothetical protein
MHLTYRDPLAHTGVVSAASGEAGAPEIEITSEMLRAGGTEFLRDHDDWSVQDRVAAIYRAMVLARARK